MQALAAAARHVFEVHTPGRRSAARGWCDAAGAGPAPELGFLAVVMNLRRRADRRRHTERLLKGAPGRAGRAERAGDCRGLKGS